MGSGTAIHMNHNSSLTIHGYGSEYDDVPPHMGRRISDAGIWYADSNGDIPIQGGLITGSATDSCYGAITV